MDQETQRYYEDLIRGLRHWHPEQQTFTREQIDELSVPEWGETLRQLDTKREGALEAIRAIMPDPAARAEAERNAARYYDQRSESFDRHYSEAVNEVYRQNGITPEIQNPEVEHSAQAVSLYAAAPEPDRQNLLGRQAEFLHGDQSDTLRKLSERQHNREIPRANFLNGRQEPEVLPGTPQPPSGEGPGGSSSRSSSLALKQQLIPPLDFTLRYRDHAGEPAGSSSAQKATQSETWEEFRARRMQESQNPAQRSEQEIQPTRELDFER